MNKKEILEKAQKIKIDEREETIKISSFRFGWISVSVLIVALAILRWINKESVADLICIISMQYLSTSLYYFVNTKQKEKLITIIISGIAFIFGVFALLSQ